MHGLAPGGIHRETRRPWAARLFLSGLSLWLAAALIVPVPGLAQRSAYWENQTPKWENACAGTLDLRLLFEDAFDERAPLPMMVVQQRSPLQREATYIGRDPGTRVYKQLADRPCAQAGLVVILNRVLMQTEQGVRPSARTVVCLRAGARALPPGELAVHLLCREGETCLPDIGTEGVEVCPDSAPPREGRGFGVRRVPVAYEPGSGEGQPGWGVPGLTALQTILKAERPGYTRFRIEGETGLAGATHAAFGVLVNGTPIYIDYQPHFAMPLRVGVSGGLAFEFALPTLVFSAPRFGIDEIEVHLRVFKDTDKLAEYRLRRGYKALRNATPLRTQPANAPQGPEFLWTGTYLQPANIGKFEIFVFASKDRDEALRQRAALERYGAEFQGRPVVGVIRPPLGRNPYYGLVLGLQRETGQIQFTFDDATSQRLCSFALDVRKDAQGRKIIHVDVNRYELEPRAPGTPKFVFCRDLVS